MELYDKSPHPKHMDLPLFLLDHSSFLPLKPRLLNYPEVRLGAVSPSVRTDLRRERVVVVCTRVVSLPGRTNRPYNTLVSSVVKPHSVTIEHNEVKISTHFSTLLTSSKDIDDIG